MNQKKAKALRKGMRLSGIDPTEVKLDERFHRRNFGKFGIGVFVHRQMHKHCGRKTYQTIKRGFTLSRMSSAVA